MGVNRVLQRNLVHPSYLEIVKMKRKIESQLKSQYLCAEILERKAKLCMKDCILLWRCNIRKLQSEKLDFESNVMIETREDVVD